MKGILSTAHISTDTGNPLTEEQVFTTMRALSKRRPPCTHVVGSFILAHGGETLCANCGAYVRVPGP